MRKKKTSRQKMYERLDKLASEIVRSKGRCILCGKPLPPEKLNAHHWIVTKGHSTKYRWDLRNLVPLCYACHIHKIHSTASLKYLDNLKKNAIAYGIATTSDIEEITGNYEIVDYSMGDLEEIYNKLKEKQITISL